MTKKSMARGAFAVAVMVGLADGACAPPLAASLQSTVSGVMQVAMCQYSNCLIQNCENADPGAFLPLVAPSMQAMAQGILKCSSFDDEQCTQQIQEDATLKSVAGMVAGTTFEALLSMQVGTICASPNSTTTRASCCLATKPTPMTCAKVDCVSTTGQWGPCSATCGGGTQTRNVTVTSQTALGGTACPAAKQACNPAACPSTTAASIDESVASSASQDATSVVKAILFFGVVVTAAFAH